MNKKKPQFSVTETVKKYRNGELDLGSYSSLFTLLYLNNPDHCATCPKNYGYQVECRHNCATCWEIASKEPTIEERLLEAIQYIENNN